jgi:hypothetical protein
LEKTIDQKERKYPSHIKEYMENTSRNKGKNIYKAFRYGSRTERAEKENKE